MITEMNIKKASSFKLCQGLEEAVEKAELLCQEKLELENEIESSKVTALFLNFFLYISVAFHIYYAFVPEVWFWDELLSKLLKISSL